MTFQPTAENRLYVALVGISLKGSDCFGPLILRWFSPFGSLVFLVMIVSFCFFYVFYE